jgi:hypothetical protein
MTETLTKNCLFCGKLIIKPQTESLSDWNDRHKYCSRECANNSRIGKPAWNKGISTPKGEQANNWKGGLPFCKKCGKQLSQRHPKLFLCVKCANQWKAENGLSAFCKGHKPYKINCWWKGKKRPEDVGKKISKSLLASEKFHLACIENGKRHKGVNHWQWKGGISGEQKLLRSTKEYKVWQQSVFKRDYWTCQECGAKHKDIVAHHIKKFSDYPDLRFEPDNGITLCRSCHKKLHKEIGLKTRFSKINNTILCGKVN